MTKITIVNGPNLGRLGRREPEVYGKTTWAEFESTLHQAFPSVSITSFQSNHEGQILDFLESEADAGAEGFIVNPGALTHQSYALRDCLAGLGLPFIEVHLSNVYAREPFRATSLIAPVALGQIAGLGLFGYQLAVSGLLHHFQGIV